MNISRLVTISSLIFVLAASAAAAKEPRDAADEPPEPMSAATFAGLELRGIGPALMSGRIADIAIHPSDPSIWYVAVGSGGVWKTVNAGTTWTPIFDDQSSYSIGCVSIDPSNPNVVWVGSGENVGGRHVGYGDGVYVSRDGGRSWTNAGLGRSEHIAKIVVHPTNSDVVWVAAQGPLWSKGGERGIYRTEDGGKTWMRTLGDDEWTGATDLVIDPRDPDRLYAATWQRHRTVAAYMGGGPRSGIYASEDGGRSWTRLENGLPKGALGKIGLAISPIDPDVLYAAIELDRRTGGVWRSPDRGASWEKRSDAVSGATGPHYYQELVASPHAFDRIYLMDVKIQVSDDGGRTFRRLTEADKHSDNHALVFRADDPDWLLAGTDGGLYESFDLAATWRFVANLPVTQFYKLAVDDAEPFYTIYGGTQDNNTQGGPSRTDNRHGIRNADWFITLFGDGHQPATEPGNPDIVYSQWQRGNLTRVDRTTGEIVYIQPQPEADDPPERFNWDAPVLISPHSPTRVWFASQRLWRSDDRGDSWRPVSPDLTRDQDRMLLPLMGRQQSWDAPWDMWAMSNYNTITAIAESPLVQGRLWVGTDDGLIQFREGEDAPWRAIDVASLPGAPAGAYVNDIKADLFDADTVYVALDAHKQGDFTPYLYRGTARGKRWTSIAGDLPDRHVVWRVVQDHVRPELLFAGTEFGVFFTPDGGKRWVELTGGVPTIAFRDLAIQRRENDLIGATFGRGFYVLDDYAPLRAIDDEALAQEALLFPVRRAWWYIERTPLGSGTRAAQGASYFVAPNPPFGAVFTYYLREGLTTRAERRKKEEKPLIEAGEDTPRPSWDEIEAERREPEPAIVFTVRDTGGHVVRRLTGPSGRGVHRVAWNLRFPPVEAIRAGGGGGSSGFPGDDAERGSHLVAPGRYTVEMAKRVDGQVTPLAGPVPFEVVRMRRGALEGAEPDEVVAFWERLYEVQKRVSATGAALDDASARVERLALALGRSRAAPGPLDAELESIRQELLDIEAGLEGSPSKNEVGEPVRHTVRRRLSAAMIGTSRSTYGPTPTHRRTLEIAEAELDGLAARLRDLTETRIPELEESLKRAGAPWTSGAPLP